VGEAEQRDRVAGAQRADHDVVRVRGVLDDLQPLLLQARRPSTGRPPAGALASASSRGGSRRRPRPRRRRAPAGRRGAGEEGLQRPVELDRVDEAALLQQRLDPADLPRDRAVVVVVAHASSSRDSQTSTVTLWSPSPNSSAAEKRTV
jgi:hypothetical protein